MKSWGSLFQDAEDKARVPSLGVPYVEAMKSCRDIELTLYNTRTITLEIEQDLKISLGACVWDCVSMYVMWDMYISMTERSNYFQYIVIVYIPPCCS
jgi:hypothetical protein